MAKKLGYKPAPIRTGPGSLKMKAGKSGPVGKEKAAPMHASTYMSKVIADMRKQGHHQVKAPKKSGNYAS